MTARSVIALTLGLACGGCADSGRASGLTGAMTATAPSALPPPASTHTVSGRVTEHIGSGSRPAAGREVGLWIEQQTGPMSFSGWSSSALTDSEGRYVASVPPSRVFVTAWRSGEVQPCLAFAAVNQDTVIDVELFDRPPFVGAASVLPQPLVIGAVYESTAAGRRPLSGVKLWFDWSVDVYVAYTETDAAGRFVLCGASAGVRLDAYLDGYEPAGVALRGGAASVEIELKRQ